MRSLVNLLLIVSLAIVPMQHLLAATAAIQVGMAIAVSGEHEHAAHLLDALSTEDLSSDIEKQADSSCKSSKTCKFCLCLAIIAENPSSQAILHPAGAVEPLRNFQSTSLFPELRPPRNT